MTSSISTSPHGHLFLQCQQENLLYASNLFSRRAQSLLRIHLMKLSPPKIVPFLLTQIQLILTTFEKLFHLCHIMCPNYGNEIYPIHSVVCTQERGLYRLCTLGDKELGSHLRILPHYYPSYPKTGVSTRMLITVLLVI